MILKILKYITFTLVILLFASAIGMCIINVIDKRLSDITINIPKQNVVLKIPEKTSIEGMNNKRHTLGNYSEHNDNGILEGFDGKIKVQCVNTHGSKSNNQPWQIDNNQCIKNHHHDEAPICEYGPTNYQDPQNMSPVDRDLFKYNYPSNMTLQDYINWLKLYQDTKEELAYDHLVNLRKINRGIKLKYEFGICPPSSKYAPPTNAEEYFNKLYNKHGHIDFQSHANSTTGALLGANYKDYSDFKQNFDQYGTSGVVLNPDIDIKDSNKKVKNFLPHYQDNRNYNTDNL
jgi:hypothetical protein